MKKDAEFKSESYDEHLLRTCQEAEKEANKSGYLTNEEVINGMDKFRADLIRKTKNAA